jgi:hypothetical protein
MALRFMFWAALHTGLETLVPIDYEGGWATVWSGCIREDTLPSAGNGTMIHQLCSHSHSHYTNRVMQIKMSCYGTSVFVTRILFVEFVYIKK